MAGSALFARSSRIAMMTWSMGSGEQGTGIRAVERISFSFVPAGA
jgi:hypothetical protein